MTDPAAARDKERAAAREREALRQRAEDADGWQRRAEHAEAELAALAAARLAQQQENEQLKRELSFVGQSIYPPPGCVQEAQKKSRAELERAGYQPNDLQAAYRGYRDGKWNQSPLYDPKLTEMAIVDALVEQGGTTAWGGDGVGCVAQMIDAQAERADAAEAAVTALRQELQALPRHRPEQCPKCGALYLIAHGIDRRCEGCGWEGEERDLEAWIRARDLADRLAKDHE